MQDIKNGFLSVTILTAIALSAAMTGCAKKETGFLGSAVIEAETWQVPALVQGPLLTVLRDEGDAVRRGDLLAVIDTLPYALQYAEAEANLRDLSAGAATQSSQIRSLQADAKGLEQEAGRARALSQSGASTPQQVDKAVAARDAARYRVEASKNSLHSLEARRQALQARLELLANQLERCKIPSPADGRVLTRYHNPGEAVSPGQSVFEIGRSDSVHADFFVTQAELSTLRLGDTVRVRLGGKSDAREVPAVIRFISSEAEFTPKNIQTRESRAELIFRVRAVSASGDGALKRGLPVEIWR
jgi:HlyD family secretion protein